MHANELAAARATYRNLRASVTRMTAAQFDRLALAIVIDDSDGEEVLASHWLRAARDIVAGRNTL